MDYFKQFRRMINKKEHPDSASGYAPFKQLDPSKRFCSVNRVPEILIRISKASSLNFGQPVIHPRINFQ